MSNEKNLINGKKYLLILGAGASMSLVPDEQNKDKRMPSGTELVNYIADFHKDIILLMMVLYSGHLINNSYYITYLFFKKYVCIDKTKDLTTIIEEAKLKLSQVPPSPKIASTIMLILEYLASTSEIRHYWLSQSSTSSATRWNDLDDIKVTTTRSQESTRTWVGCNGIYSKLFQHGNKKLTEIDTFQSYFFYHPQISQINLCHLTYLFTISVIVNKHKDTISSLDEFANSIYLLPSIQEDFKMLDGTNGYLQEIFQKIHMALASNSHTPSIDILMEYYLKWIIANFLDIKTYDTINYLRQSQPNTKTFMHHVVSKIRKEAVYTCKTESDLTQYMNENLSIITFNYDDISEHILQNILKHIENIQIHHVYGKLCLPILASNGTQRKFDINCTISLPREDAPTEILQQLVQLGDSYDKKSIVERIVDISKKIQWIRRPIEFEQGPKSININLIKQADNIYFLGFGFAEPNLENIGLDKISVLNGKKVYISKGNKDIMLILEKLGYTFKKINDKDVYYNVT